MISLSCQILFSFLIFLDLSAAFDTLDHPLLLDTLFSLGFHSLLVLLLLVGPLLLSFLLSILIQITPSNRECPIGFYPESSSLLPFIFSVSWI